MSSHFLNQDLNKNKGFYYSGVFFFFFLQICFTHFQTLKTTFSFHMVVSVALSYLLNQTLKILLKP